ncbi:MAG: Gfo/Idh/MocA family oxidoreductase [Saprospiraceae bacterium]|nr:Gfo/Idh/MocA family oxidoreductase [Saprospiraceae bacterium]
MKTFNWGIIGMGRIARKFADDLKLLPNARLHAVASTSQERADAFATEYGASHAYGKYEDIIHCPDLDVVYVATPHVLHCENTLLCLNNGIPVLCEKPFAMNIAQTRAMIDAARKNRVFLMEALWTLFIPGVVKVFDLLESGAIGHLHTVKADLGFNMPFDPASRVYNKSLGAGALLDLGIYPTLLSLALFGQPQREDIYAMATFTQTDVDESCAFMFRYPDKRLMLGHCTISANTSLTATLYGSEGSIHLHPRWHHTPKLTVSTYNGREETKYDLDLPYEGHGYHYEAKHVMLCLENEQLESDIASHELTLGLAETLDAIRDEIGLVYE